MLVALYWVAWVGRVVRVAVVIHCIHLCWVVLATIHRVQMLRHLWSLVDRHEYWDEEMGVSEALAKQLHELCHG